MPAERFRAGAYSLYNTYRTFSVAPGGRSMVNVAIGVVPIACSPRARDVPSTDQIVLPRVAIGRDGSFSATATRSGVFAGSPATFTYAFSGNFRGADATGRTTVAGLLREDVVFTDPGKHSCTSNTLAWTGVG